MRKRIAMWIFLLLLAAQAPMHATALARMSLEELSAASDAVVEARCLGNEVRQEGGEIWTFANFQVEGTAKGIVPPLITVRLLGGRLGHLTSHVEGVPQFQPGEEVILFLHRTRAGDFAVTSWMQGTFRIRRDARTGEATVTQDSSGAAVFDPKTRSFRYEGIRRAPLAEFRAHLQAILSRQANGRER